MGAFGALRAALRMLPTAALSVLLLAGCSLGGGAPAPAANGNVTLGLKTAVPEEQPTADTFTVELTATDAHELYQLSCRIGYDTAALRFIGAERGALLPTSAIFFASERGIGFVPLAFTCKRGGQLTAGSGVVATLRFEVLDPQAEPALMLLDDPEFLIARDSSRRALSVQLEVAP